MRIVYFTDCHDESFGIRSIGDVPFFVEFMQQAPKSRRRELPDGSKISYSMRTRLAKVRLRRDNGTQGYTKEDHRTQGNNKEHAGTRRKTTEHKGTQSDTDGTRGNSTEHIKLV